MAVKMLKQLLGFSNRSCVHSNDVKGLRAKPRRITDGDDGQVLDRGSGARSFLQIWKSPEKNYTSTSLPPRRIDQACAWYLKILKAEITSRINECMDTATLLARVWC